MVFFSGTEYLIGKPAVVVCELFTLEEYGGRCYCVSRIIGQASLEKLLVSVPIETAVRTDRKSVV